jgi:hypothetical protein
MIDYIDLDGDNKLYEDIQEMIDRKLARETYEHLIKKGHSEEAAQEIADEVENGWLNYRTPSVEAAIHVHIEWIKTTLSQSLEAAMISALS